MYRLQGPEVGFFSILGLFPKVFIRITTLEPTTADAIRISGLGGSNMLTGQSPIVDCIYNTKQVSSHGGFLTNAIHLHRRTKSNEHTLITLVYVYVDLLVFTRIAGTS